MLPSLPLVLLSAPWSRRQGQSAAVALAVVTWAMVGMTFYAYYEFTGQTWWYLRFVLPVFPCLLVLSLLGLRRLTVVPWPPLQRWDATWRRLTVAGVAVAVVVAGIAVQMRSARTLDVVAAGGSEIAYIEACDWLRRQAPVRSVRSGT